MTEQMQETKQFLENFATYSDITVIPSGKCLVALTPRGSWELETKNLREKRKKKTFSLSFGYLFPVTCLG